MGEIIKIDLGGGFDKQSEPNLVGTGFIELRNVHNLQKGAFRSRKGFGTPTSIGGKTFLDLVWWIEPVSGTLYWFAYDYDSSKQIIRMNDSFGSSSTLENVTDGPARINIYNYGNSVRFVKGIEHNASVYQKVDRKYFNQGISYLHWQHKTPLSALEDETITLISSTGTSRTYKWYHSDYDNSQNFSGAVEGGSYQSLLFNDSPYTDVADTTLLIKALNTDGTTTHDVTYKFDNTGTKTTGDTDGTYTYVDINDASVDSNYAVVGELYDAIASDGGHQGLIDTPKWQGGNIAWLRQSVPGTAGNTTVTKSGAGDIQLGSTIGDSADFIGGSTSTNIIVSNNEGSGWGVDDIVWELQTAIQHKNGHNGELSVSGNKDSDGTTTLNGGVYVKQLLYNSIIGTDVTVSGGFNATCDITPASTFSSGAGYEKDGFIYDTINYPRLDGVTFEEPVLSVGGVLPFTSDNKNIHYKVAPVFDGIQEGMLSESVIGPVATTTNTNTIAVPIIVNDSTFNPRMTGLNVYRAITDGEYPGDGDYYQIDHINIIAGASSNFANTNQGFIGRRVVSGWNTENFIADYSTSSLYEGKQTFNSVKDCDGGTSTITDWNSNPVKEGDLFMEGSTQDNILTNDSNNSNGNMPIDGLNTQMCLQNILSVSEGFVFVDREPYVDEFGGDRYWWIGRNWLGTIEPYMLARGGLTSGTCDGIDGWTEEGGSITDTDPTWHLDPSGVDVDITRSLVTTESITGFQGGELFHIGGRGSVEGGSSGDFMSDSHIKLKIIPSPTGVETTVAQCPDGTNSFGGYFTLPSNATSFKVKAEITANNTDDESFGADTTEATLQSIHCVEIVRSGTKIWHHESMFGIKDSGWRDDVLLGKVVTVESSKFAIASNSLEVARVVGDSGWHTGLTSEDFSHNFMNREIKGNDYQWTKSGSQHTVTIYDAGKGATTVSPLNGVTSLDTRYKVSATVNGRTFGCNVNLFDTIGTNNAYSDMLIYSELQQPDVMPISNYIKLNDLQGGAIVGVAGLMSDLVVFAERGIFRLNVPSADPTGWSLVESEPNLGCTQPYSVKEWKNGVFFAGTDNIYYITPNFEFVSISDNWRDLYQSKFPTTDEANQTVIEIDNDNERLLVKYGTEKDKLNIMDLNAFAQKKLFWYEYHKGQSEGSIESISVKNDSTVYLVNIADGTDTKIRELNPSSQFGTHAYFFRTGYISLSSMTDNEDMFIRRINFNLQQDSSSGDCEVTVHLNHRKNYNGTADVSGGQSVTKSFDPNTAGKDNIYSLRIGRRAKGFQLEFRSTVNSGDGNVLRELEIEVD